MSKNFFDLDPIVVGKDQQKKSGNFFDLDPIIGKAGPALEDAVEEIKAAAQKAKPYVEDAVEKAKPYVNTAVEELKSAAEKATPYVENAMDEIKNKVKAKGFFDLEPEIKTTRFKTEEPNGPELVLEEIAMPGSAKKEPEVFRPKDNPVVNRVNEELEGIQLELDTYGVGGMPTYEETKPKFCNNCGAELEEDARFCSNCGTHVGHAE